MSGGHFNRVGSFVDAHFGGISWRDAAYLPAQVAGCILGAITANAMFAKAAMSISTHHRATPARRSRALWRTRQGAIKAVSLQSVVDDIVNGIERRADMICHPQRADPRRQGTGLHPVDPRASGFPRPERPTCGRARFERSMKGGRLKRVALVRGLTPALFARPIRDLGDHAQVGLDTTVMSYQHRLDFGLVADREQVPDLPTMASALSVELRACWKGLYPPPGRRAAELSPRRAPRRSSDDDPTMIPQSESQRRTL